jgi:phage protein D
MTTPIPAISQLQPHIYLDGEADSSLNNNLISMMVEETAAGLARCEARFTNWGTTDGDPDYLYFGRDILDFGRDLAVHMSDNGSERAIFSGRITGLEAEYPPSERPTIVALAEDRLQNFRLRRRWRTFQHLTDGAIIAQIAQEHGLQVQPSLTTIQTQHPLVVQANQSDLAFIRERADQIDALVLVQGDHLLLLPRPGFSGDPLSLRLHRELIHFKILADLAHQVTEVHVTGWDSDNKTPVDAAADDQAIQSDLGDGVGSSAVLHDRFGDVETTVVHKAPTSQAEAQAIANARYRERARRFVTGTGLAHGDFRLRVGLPVRLEGLGPLFDGTYYITRTRHTFDRTQGYRTEFDVERPSIGRPYRSTDRRTDQADKPDSAEVANQKPGQRRKLDPKTGKAKE